MLIKRLVSTALAGALLAVGVTTSSAAAHVAPAHFMDYTDDAFSLPEVDDEVLVSAMRPSVGFVTDQDLMQPDMAVLYNRSSAAAMCRWPTAS